MMINFCARAIFCSVLVMWFFTNCRVISHASGQVRYESSQLKETALCNNILAFIELVFIMLIEYSDLLHEAQSIFIVLLAIVLVMINLFLTFTIEPVKSNAQSSDNHQQRRPLISKTVNELLLITNKNHKA